MNLPADFILKYQKLLPNQAVDFLASFNQPPTAGFRINPLKAQLDLLNENCTFPISNLACAYYGRIDGKGIDNLAGWIYSQDPSAMNVAQYAAPQANEKVLDLCAAPGGKTTQLAALMGDQGLLVANDINYSRARVLSNNVERWGLTHTLVTNNTPAELAKIFPDFFDCIVVDAPCSGEGLFRKNPEATTYWSLGYVQKCAQRQREILNEAVKMLRPGGRLIYSTCTFAPEEDEQNIDWLQQKYGWKILPLKHFVGMDTGCPQWGNNNIDLKLAVRLFPHHYQGEGHFICAIKKPGTIDQPESSVKLAAHSSNIDLKLWQEFAVRSLRNVNFPTLIVQQRTLYNAAKIFNQQSQPLKILRNGLRLGEFKKKRFEPNHALVLTLKPQQLQQVISLNSDQFQHFIHGEILTLTNKEAFKGWVAVSFEERIFSWGKLVNNQLKNFYPKGLRQ